jgi:hypothetical protein
MEELGYLATWLPTVVVEPGDIGVITNYEFQKVGTLDAMGIRTRKTEPRARGSFDFRSKGAVRVEAKVAGQIPAIQSSLADTDTGLVVQFTRRNAVAFKADDCKSVMLEDLERIGSEVLGLYHTNSWPDDYVVVTEVLLAKSTTALISNGDHARIELRATAGIQADQLSLASAEAKFITQRETNMGLSVIAKGGLTPLFRARAIRKRLLRAPVFRETTGDSVFEYTFDSVDYEDFTDPV